ncbi:MAG: SecDF P1 head subdomain-containing protein [Solirubrobacteraceae bacterium]
MTTADPVITKLAKANPVSEAPSPDPHDRAQADQLLERVLAEAPPPRRARPRAGILVPVVSVLLVLVVAAVILRTGGSSTTSSSSNGGLRITLVAQPTPQTPRITSGAMTRELALVRQRLRSVLRRFTVTRAHANGLVITGPKVSAADRARIIQLITQPGRLFFYDWEGNVLAPDGHTVAQELVAQNPPALMLSQGAGGAPGQPGAGSTSLYDAVSLAAKQPARTGPGLTRRGPEYYMFGSPGSAACAAAAAAEHTAPAPGAHCLLAGPLDLAASAGRRQALDALEAQLPSGVSRASGHVIAVPQGTRVLQAEAALATGHASFSDPATQFFVLRDDPAMSGLDIVDPVATRDQAGNPAVNFGFTTAGRRAFQRTTRQVARRGANVSLSGATLNQHFAIVLDDQLVTVPSILFMQYPDGIASGGADIAGLTGQAARDLATQLRSGALPLALRVVS